MMKEAIAKLMNKQDLTYEEARQVMDEIMDGKVSATLISSYLTALSMKGETIDEISGSAYAMRAHATKAPHDMDVLEIVGTGGDGANTFNISSTSAMVIAAGGVPVAKHGNRAASSKSGAADVLEALGVNISLPPEKCRALLEQVGICFLFAQTYHTAMKYVGPVRKELGIQSLLEPYAAVMQNLGIRRGLVVYGTDRLDEISASAPTAVCEIRDGKTNLYEITPEQFGYTRCQKSDLLGGTPEENAQITRNILSGQDKGPKRQAVCLNAGAALYAAGSAETMEAGVRLAEYLIDSGKAMEKLQQFVEASNQ